MLSHALHLEYFTVGWNLIEGAIGVTAALAASSVSLLGFGVDSFVESASGGVLIWRLLTERRLGDACSVERLEQRAGRLVALSLFLLALYVACDAAHTLWMRERPLVSYVGIGLTVVSMGLMMFLARAKRRAAAALGSQALHSDSVQTTACWYLSVITLTGLGLNATMGWWWADPVAALGMTIFLLKEGMAAWRGEGCGCSSLPARPSCTVPTAMIVLALLVPLSGAWAWDNLQDPATTPESRLPFVHGLFTDSMVLQRDVRFPVWGWTQPGRKVKVRFLEQEYTATAGPDGRWQVRLGPFHAGGPWTMEIIGPRRVVLKDVLIGDVWVCSGQSNMQMGLAQVQNGRDEVARGNHPRIRLFTVPERVAWAPQKNVEGHWLACTPENLMRDSDNGFSAVAYFFGRELGTGLKVPIGLIHTSWGGTPAEAWTSKEALRALGSLQPAHGQLDLLGLDRPLARYKERVERWWAQNDPGSASPGAWAADAVDTSAWRTMNAPQAWEKAGLGDFDGVAWLRREVHVPADWVGRDLVLHLGLIGQRDTTWFNGEAVGASLEWWAQRAYRVPARLVRPGRNVIAVRVLDRSGPGGFIGTPDQMYLSRADGAGVPQPLAGPWMCRVGIPLKKVRPVPVFLDGPTTASVLYNGMVAPLAPYAIRGVTWYQGESNTGRPADYGRLLAAMIANWRATFACGDFPFLVVGLANFGPRASEPGRSAWAELREQQAWVADHVKAVGMALAIDIGDGDDIHPKNKLDVGRRLALAARALAYHEPIEARGPRYAGLAVEDGRVRVRFEHAAGLQARGDTVQGFAVAGADRRFVWAQGRIEAGSVVVWSPRVPRPVAVRYAWGDNPACNLYNGSGLPALPFRSDTWKD